MSKESSKKAMTDDLFFSLVLLVMSIVFGIDAWELSDWGRFGSCVFIGIFSGLWFAMRVYHFTHQDEVFGENNGIH